jgi:hypothetical protein
MIIPFEFSYEKKKSGLFFYIKQNSIQTPEDLIKSKLFKYLSSLKVSRASVKKIEEEEIIDYYIYLDSYDTKFENIEFFSIGEALVKKDASEQSYMIYFPITKLNPQTQVELATKDLFINDKEEIK